MPLALFDVDGTLIRGTLYGDLFRVLHRAGLLGVRHLAWGSWIWGSHRLGIVHGTDVIRRAVGLLEGLAEPQAEALYGSVLRRARPRLHPEMVDLLSRHREDGDRVILVSTSLDGPVRLLAAELGAEGCIATRPEILEGRLTGKTLDPIPFGQGKVPQAEELARKLGQDLRDAWFYSDSFSDLPLLERVGHPRPVRPDPRLRREAEKRGWGKEP